MRLTFQAPDRTLTDAEVHAAMEAHRRATLTTAELGRDSADRRIRHAWPRRPRPPPPLNRSIASKKRSRLLVSVIGRLRGEQSRVVEDNARLQREVETLKARITEAEGAAGELTELRGERDQIRTRVSEMLQQLDALNL